ncbi:MAG: hypothetical protein M3O86_02495 [Actinomycetota bacterium]|nr:hypothetical protein [Actinomycetota bacterium]
MIPDDVATALCDAAVVSLTWEPLMTTPPQPAVEAATHSRWRPALRAGGATLAGLAVHLVLMWAVVAMEQRRNPPTCFGIGFGCTPEPGTTALLWGVIVAVPVTLVVLGGAALTAALPDPRWRRRAAGGLAGAYLVVALTVPFLLPAT